MVRHLLGGSIAVTLLLSGCGSPLYTVGSFARGGSNAALLASSGVSKSQPAAQLGSAPLDRSAAEQPAGAALFQGKASLVDTQDMNQDEVAEDAMTVSPTVQSVAMQLTHFHKVGVLREVVGGGLVLESTTGIWFWKKTTEYAIQASPSVTYMLRQHLNEKLFVEGDLDGNHDVSVTEFREVLNLSAIFNGFTKGRIVGTVVDSKRWPIPGATVTAVRTVDSVLFRESADANGTFTFRGLNPGDYVVSFQHGSSTASIDVTVTKRKATILEGDL